MQRCLPHCDKQRRASPRLLRCICARECRCRCWLATYAGEPLLFPRESAYVVATKKRSGRDCGGRKRDCERGEREREGGTFFSFVFPVFHSLFPSLARLARGLLFPSAKPKPRPVTTRPLFPTRKRSLRRFVSEGDAVVTNFAPPPHDFNSRSRKHNSR